MADFVLAGREHVELLLRFMEDFYAHDGLTFEPARSRAALEGLLDEPSFGRAWLIRDAGVTIGYVVLCLGYSLEYHGRDAFVDEIFIVEAQRGKGLGGQALAFLEAQCRALGVEALHLEVERSNLAAHRLYRKAGFEQHDRQLLTRRLRHADA